jgi:hypothetical protein
MAIKFCSACGVAGNSKIKAKGSFLMELVLWLLFCFPGIIYSVWRLTTKAEVCGHCGSAVGLLPPGSPMALMMAEKLRQPPPS